MLFSRICFSFPQGSQPCAASAVMISTCFKHNLPGILLHYHWPDACLPATIKTAKAHVICSSFLLSWCFSFCNIIRNGCLAMPLPNQVSSWDSWDFTNTGHCILIHLHKSPGTYSHVFTKQTWELTEWNRTRWPRKENRTKIKQGCLLSNVCGSYGPKKSTCLLLKEWEKENIRIHIHASSAAASASSVASASASLAWGFYSWSIATCRLRKKSVEIIIHHNFCKHLQPVFLNLSRRNQSWHVMQHHHIILGMYTVCFTKIFSSGTAKTHLICSSLLLSWCFSFCNIVRSGLMATELTAQMLS